MMMMDDMEPYCFSPVAGTDIPLDHLDYGYVKSCKDIKEICGILKILRSGKEGHYPELISCTEKRLSELDPNNKLLIKDKPAGRMADLSHDEFTKLNDDLQQWADHVTDEDSSDKTDEDRVIPPVRKSGVFTKDTEPTNSISGSSRSSERIKSYDYDSWSKFDTEKEAAKVDKDTPTSNIGSPPRIPCELSDKERSLSSADKERMADREKEKGNEAYRAGDMEEAFSYYSRSLNFNPSVAAYNNRAMTEIKLKRYQAAVNDCSSVLKIESNNTKALFRRGTAFKQLDKLHQASTDFERCLHFDPNNKKAQQELNTLRKRLSDTENGGKKNEKKTGRRVRIVEDNSYEEPKYTPTNDVIDIPPPAKSPVVFPQSISVNSLPDTNDQGPPPLPTQVQALKDVGNQLFRAGQYSEASQKYTLAIALLQTGDKSHEPNLSMLLNNRAACHLKIGNSPACIADCTHSISLMAVNVKAFMRRAQAYESMEKYKLAYVDYQLASSIDCSLPSAYEATSRITRILRDMEGNGWRDKLPVSPDAARVREELQRQASSFQEEQTVSEQEELTVSEQEELTVNEQEELTVNEQEGGLSFTVDQSNEQPDHVETTQMLVEDVEEDDRDKPTDADEPDADSAEPPSLSSETTDTSDTSVDESSEEVTTPPDLSTSAEGVITLPDPSISAEEVTTPPIPPIDVISGSPDTEVTQSTQAVPSPQMSATPSSKVKDDLLSPEEKFEKQKLKGNEHVKKGEFVDALRYYSMCVSLCPNRVVGYTNRALCHLKLNSPRSAETDCNKALSYEPGNLKALYRRGLARKDLGRYSESVKDLSLLLTIDPDNVTAKKELSEVKLLWEKQLRDLQSKATPGDSSRSDRKAKDRKRGSKAKSQGKPHRPKDPSMFQRPPGMSDADFERFKKLVSDIEVSKEHIEKLKTMSPPGTSWGDSLGGLGDLPFTGPPRTGAPAGKSPTGGRRSTPSKGKPTTSRNGGATGKSPTKPKTKKVSKKPPKLNKDKATQPPQSVPTTEPATMESIEPELKRDSPPKGQRIVIEEIHTSDDQSDDETTPPTSVEVKGDQEEPSSPPQLRSPFEFVQRWNSIPRTAKSSEYARLLEAIPPLTLPDVITNKLDGIMLTNIIRAVDKQFVPKGKYQLSVDVLSSLSKVPRFGMIAMFMGPKEKSDLRNVLSALSAQSSTTIPPSTIDSLNKMYSL